VEKGRRGKDLRIGTPERERAITLLGEHMTAGRLDIHEYDERCAKAAAARFSSEITALFDDLPSPRPNDDRSPAVPAKGGPPAGNVVLVLSAAVLLVFFAVVLKQMWLVALLAVAAAIWFTRRRR
jgi:hypothetical protein